MGNTLSNEITKVKVCDADIWEVVYMSKIDEIKSSAIAKDPKRKNTYEVESKRLKTAVMIVELREAHGLTQQMLADKAGVPKSTIVRIENAQVNTTVEMLNRIAQAVGKELEMSIV